MNLILTGPMGSGKSTAGREAASTLNMDFVDTDENIVKTTGKTINELFASEGEERFRELEREEIARVSVCDNQVVATGGGVVLDPLNMRRLRRNGIIVNLTASVETLYSRLKTEADRPLISREKALEDLRRFSGGRHRFYQNKDFIIDTDSQPLEKVVKDISTIAQKPRIRLCVSVSGADPEGQVIRASETGASMVELRLDLIEKPDISGLVNASGLPVIATDRSDKASLKEAIEAGCDYVDIELDSVERADVTALARQHNVGVIASMHDFDRTPETFPEKGDADILKIATMVNSKDDLRRLLALLDGRDDLIVVGMGEPGTPIRIVAPLLGSYLTYCTVSEQTAPGQLDLESMIDMYRRMRLR